VKYGDAAAYWIARSSRATTVLLGAIANLVVASEAKQSIGQ
jgi:hypothetical protein